MSQISASSHRPTGDAEPAAAPRARRAGPAAAPPPQARQSFDAALRRADQRRDEPEAPEESSEGAEKGEMRSGALAALGALLPASAAMTAPAVAASASLAGSTPAQAMPNAPLGALPEAIPMTTATATGAQVNAGGQWRISIPAEGPAQSALGMRLINTGAGHWQLKLATDTQTRQQLTPHLDRLRDKLRQRGGGRFDDLGFDDDISA